MSDELRELLEIEENVGPRLSERYGRCQVCTLTAIHFRVGPDETLIACCSCGAEWPAPVPFFTGWILAKDEVPPESMRFLVDGACDCDALDDADDDISDLPPTEQTRGGSKSSKKEFILDAPPTPMRALRSGELTKLKTIKRTIQIELPASVGALVAGLNVPAVYPQLASVEQDLVDAQLKLEAARTDVQTRQRLVEDLAEQSARTGDTGPYSKEFAALRAAESLVPLYDDRVRRAQRGLEAARDIAREALAGEARRRQQIINDAGAILLDAVSDLKALQNALYKTALTFPTNPDGSGPCALGSFEQRDRAVAGVGQ